MNKSKYKVGDKVENFGDIGQVIEIVYVPQYRVKFSPVSVHLLEEDDLDSLVYSPKYSLGDIVTTPKGKKLRPIIEIRLGYKNTFTYTVAGVNTRYREEDLNLVFQSE